MIVPVPHSNDTALTVFFWILVSAGRILHVCSSLEKPAPAERPAIVQSHCQVLTVGRLNSSPRPARLVVSCAKTLETTVSSKSDGELYS